jgi:hypothetical protein
MVKRVSVAVKLGSVDAYMMDRVVPAAGKMVTCSEVFEDYRAWCDRGGMAPLREGEFVDAFESLARTVGVELRQRGGNLSFLEMGLDNPLLRSATSMGNR